MGTLFAKLSGYKTYIVSVGAIMTALGAYLNGAMNVTDLIFAITGALGMSTIRHGITTSTTPQGPTP